MPNRKILLGLALSATTFQAAAADLVVIVNPAAAVPSKEDVADLFLGKNPALTPIDLVDASPLRAEFYKKVTGRDLSQIKALWSRVVFTGKGLAPKQLADEAAVKKAVAADPKAVGYIEKSAVDGTVKVAFPAD